MQNLKLLLIGQPNVGKSSLLNALVGPTVIVSNYPGTTVEIIKAKKIFGETRVEFEDTPGIYSISDRSEEEKVTERALFEEDIDGAIVLADAVSLERSLYLVFQVMEAKIPVIVALNFVESARKKGIIIDYKKLAKLLGVPVIPINPITKSGLRELIDAFSKIRKTGEAAFDVKYDDDIERAIEDISSQVEGKLPKRFVSLRILEEDEDYYGYLKDKHIIGKAKENLKEHPKVAWDISITRYGTAAFIAEKITSLVNVEEKKRSLEERIDRVLLHRVWGPFFTILAFVAIFGILLYLGGWMEESLMGFAEETILPAVNLGSGFLGMALEAGLTGVMAGVSIALPYVFLFYIIFTLIEDSGLLSRFVINAERFLRKLSLPGKAIIPLALGLGCTVPGACATRILSSEKERFYTASLFTAIPCSSRLAIIMGIVGHFGGKLLAVYVLASLVVAFLIFGYIMKKVMRIQKKPIFHDLPELPTYRAPSAKNILTKSWIRMKSFVYVVIPFLIIGGMVYSVLDVLGVTKMVVKPFSPITWWLGLPDVAVIPWLFSYLQKDLSSVMLFSVLGNEIGVVLTPLQLYTFGIATTVGIPCMIATGMFWKEFGAKKSIILTLVSAIYGLLFAGIAFRVVSLFLR
jgi:ferrous iron transport protein B